MSDEKFKWEAKHTVASGITTVTIILVLMFGIPLYQVWQKELAGKAELKQAEWNRQIAVEEAQAQKESAKYLAEAEEIRAVGVAKANAIIGDSLKDNESYLRYLWIQGLHDGSSEVIYVPTEANLPILEATRKGWSKDTAQIEKPEKPDGN